MTAQSLLDVKFEELPNPRRVWVGTPGSREEGLGRLNLLTDERVAAAATEQIKTGRRVGLNWDLTKLEYPGFGRLPCEHEIVPVRDGLWFDDIYHFNPRMTCNCHVSIYADMFSQNRAASGMD